MDRLEFDKRIEQLAEAININRLSTATRAALLDYGTTCMALFGLRDIRKAGLSHILTPDAADICSDRLMTLGDKLAHAPEKDVQALGKALREYIAEGYGFIRAGTWPAFPLARLLSKLGWADEESKAATASDG